MDRTDASIHHAAVCGRRLSGKTTLCIKLCEASFRVERRYTLALDPKKNQHTWGEHAWVTSDQSAWLAKWQDPRCRNCNIVWEETSTTLKRDADLIDVFTAKAGEHAHRLIVTCHSGTALLPVMREQITEIFLFRQSFNEAKMWSELFADERIMQACNLDVEERQFLHAKFGSAPRVCRLRL